MTNTYITLDYELFFGKSGSVEKSILDPTNRLLEILDKHKVKAVFFVDVGYLIRASKLEFEHPSLKEDRGKVTNQLKELVKHGHDIQLHIHSHWEDATFEEGEWKFPMQHYRLHSFSLEEATRIFGRYKQALEDITGQRIFAFRAGGWCIQPFEYFKQAFEKYGIEYDSTVFKGGKNVYGQHYYNFTMAPDATQWNFSDNPCIQEESGRFIEIPISSYKVSPIFFWKLFLYKKWGGHIHKPMGDGYALKNGLFQKLRLLFTKTVSVVSIDGYKASYLNEAFGLHRKKEDSHNFVIIGHPKAFTNYSLGSLDSFLDKHSDIIRVRTFRDR